jgi:hypothetical protein
MTENICGGAENSSRVSKSRGGVRAVPAVRAVALREHIRGLGQRAVSPRDAVRAWA